MFLFRSLGLSLHKDDTFHKIKLLRAINHLWMLTSVAIFAFVIKNYVSLRHYSQMSDIIGILSYSLAFFTHLVILIQTQAMARKDETWHGKLDTVEELLRCHFDVGINHGIIKRRNWASVTLILACTVTCSSANVLYAMRSGDFIPLLSAHDYCLKAIINLRCLQCAFRLDLIKRHILAFHRAIRKIVERNQIEWKLIFVVDTKFNQRRSYDDHPMKIDDAKEVVIFKRIHAAIYESTKLLENCFGWSLLAILSFAFIDVTSNLYWCCLAFFDIDEKFDTIDCIVDIIPPIIVVSLLLHSSFDMGRKASEGVIFWAIKLYTNTSSDYNVMVKEFLLQLYHEKIENSANDFFLVDNKLFSAVSMVMTFYLFYFHNSEHFCSLLKPMQCATKYHSFIYEYVCLRVHMINISSS
jgi:7tm Chemosensory receptor